MPRLNRTRISFQLYASAIFYLLPIKYVEGSKSKAYIRKENVPYQSGNGFHCWRHCKNCSENSKGSSYASDFLRVFTTSYKYEKNSQVSQIVFFSYQIPNYSTVCTRKMHGLGNSQTCRNCVWARPSLFISVTHSRWPTRLVTGCATHAGRRWLTAVVRLRTSLSRITRQYKHK